MMTGNRLVSQEVSSSLGVFSIPTFNPCLVEDILPQRCRTVSDAQLYCQDLRKKIGLLTTVANEVWG